MARNDRHMTETPGMGATPSLIRWGAVFGGAVIGLSLLVLLSTLWVAIGFGNETAAVTDNLTWFLAGSAILSMFVGGLLAGWLSGVPGAGPGFFNGVTVWGLILLAGLIIGPATIMQAMGAEATVGAEQAIGELGMQGDALWATFLALLVGALAAGLGGTLGGALTRPAFVYAAPTMERTDTWTDERTPAARADRRTERTDRTDEDGKRANVEGATVDVREDRTDINSDDRTERVGARDHNGDRRR